MNARLIAELQADSSSYIRAGWELADWTWRPAADLGRTNWGSYLSCRWLGFGIRIQHFQPKPAQ